MATGYESRETILSAQNVSVSYSSKPVLKNLNLQIKNIVRPGVTQGQVVGLLGPSGVGKTTLFRCLAGLMRPDSGDIFVTDKRVPVERGMVGVVAQHYPLFAHRTVLGNLQVAGAQAGLSASEAKAKSLELLTRFGVAEQRNSYPAQLSGGQRQRVAIAQQFMCSDHFLLMDEPFSGLDLIAIERVSRFISEIALTDELKTIVLVTHDIDAALAVCDTIWLLGRDRDSDGILQPGARIQQIYNLADLGLAWRENIGNTPEFLTVLGAVREAFRKL